MGIVTAISLLHSIFFSSTAHVSPPHSGEPSKGKVSKPAVHE
jgi:hypothetical protein